MLKNGATAGALALGGAASADTALAGCSNGGKSGDGCPVRVKRTHDCESKNPNALEQGGRLVTFHDTCPPEDSIWEITMETDDDADEGWCNDHSGRIRCYHVERCDSKDTQDAHLCVRGSFPIDSQWQVVEEDECLPRGNGGGGRGP